MTFLSKYGAARHFYVPMVKRAVVDHAVGADWTPAAGDVKISKDGGAAANVTNLPTAIAMGNSTLWDFSLTATEMQAAQIVVTVADSATKAVEDNAFIVETYGHASAQHAVDLDDGVRAGLTALPNAAADAAGGLPISDAGGLDLDARLDAAVSTRLASASYTAPPSAASIRAEMDANSTDLDAIGALATAIKAKTDNLAFTVANRVDSQVLGVQSAAANLKKNAAFSAFEFVMTDSTNHNPATGLTVTATRSIDGAAFAACANAVAEVASGVYKIDLAAADLNGNAITLRFTATGADDRLITVITQP